MFPMLAKATLKGWCSVGSFFYLFLDNSQVKSQRRQRGHLGVRGIEAAGALVRGHDLIILYTFTFFAILPSVRFS